MSTLLLMRHADYKDTNVTPYGFEQCGRIAKQLGEKGFVPESAICSEVMRAFETAKSVMAPLNLNVAPEKVKSLTPLTDEEKDSAREREKPSSFEAQEEIFSRMNKDKTQNTIKRLLELGRQHKVTLAVTHAAEALWIAKILDTEAPSLGNAECLVFEMPDTPVEKPRLIEHLRPL